MTSSKQPHNDNALATGDRQPGVLREFADFLMLFFGISTKSNLSRTQTRPVQSSGLFLFRKGRGK